MSRVTKRKHVMNEALWDDLELPKEDHSVVKVLKSMGNNLHQVLYLHNLILFFSSFAVFMHLAKWGNRFGYKKTVKNQKMGLKKLKSLFDWIKLHM